MINIKIENVGSLTERETTALAMMFMHLGGHQLQPNTDPEITTLNVHPAPPQDDVPNSTDSDSIVINEIDWAKADEQQNIEHMPIPPTSYDALQTDSTGMLWDERIHAKNMSKTAKGEWKLGRNIPNDLVKKVMHELRAKSNRIIPTPPLPVVPAMPELPVFPVVPTVNLMAAPASISQPVAPAPLPLIPQENPFDKLVQRITKSVSEKKINVPHVLQIIQSFKTEEGISLCNTVADIAKHPHIIMKINESLDKACQ